MRDYYKTLGLKRGASKSQIRKKWLELAKRYHPDHNPDDPAAEDRFKEIQIAYSFLIDDNKRAIYDLTGSEQYSSAAASQSQVENYFYCKVMPSTIPMNDEVHVAFTYSSAGRLFNRPGFRDFHVTGPPYVSSRYVIHNGISVRETTLTFIVCPLRQGTILIDPASIQIGTKKFTSDPQTVLSLPRDCFYMKNQLAGPDPYEYPMHYESERDVLHSNKSWRRLHHVVLIPRSRTAMLFHTLGSALKIVCTISAVVYFAEYVGIYAAAVAGNVIGWVNCRMLYAVAGVKPKFRYSDSFPLVQEYLEKGYESGVDQAFPMVKSNWIYWVTKSMT
ncbi:MAG TPA: DnaJ domain-containing protein [Bacteroidia bacterium]|nr:DnaJ domain-containing protein [Bacteroidia bacterium]